MPALFHIFTCAFCLLLNCSDAFSKVCVFSEFDPSTQSRCVFKSFHSGERFQKFAFSHRFRVDGTCKRIKMFAYSNENAS